MNSYGFLAGCYDEFTTDVDYAAWAEYIQRHFERAGLPGSTVLDLACGTGSLSRGLDAPGLLEEVLSDFQLEVLETHPVEYRCSCSRERVSRALISMGREELSSLIAEQGQADLSCQFCDKVYHFSKEELEGLLSSM